MNAKKIIFHHAAIIAVAASLVACSSKSGPNPEPGDDDEIEVMAIAVDSTDLVEPTEVIPTDETDPSYNDYVENAKTTRNVSIVYNGSTVTTSGDVSAVTISTSGAHVTVKSTKKNVAFHLSGASSDGSFKIYSDHKFILELNGLSINNPTGPAINNQCGKSLYLQLADGTYNSLSDGSAYESAPVGEAMKGTLFSEGQILISGKGSLKINAKARNGLCSDDYILVRPGCKIFINSTANNAIKANDGVTVNGGVINLVTSGNGAKGINCESHIAFNGGRTTVINSGNTTVTTADTTSCSGIKADSTLTVSAGTVNVKCSGNDSKGINCANKLTITGGNVNVVTLGSKKVAAPKAIKADGNIAITGGNVYSYSKESAAIDTDGSLTLGVNPKSQKSGTHYFIINF